MKRRFSVIFIILAFIMSISCLGGFVISKAFADEITDSIKTTSKSAYLIDENTKTVIYSKNENERLPIASMCKIMTLLLCFEASDRGQFSIDDEITISENASSMGGSQVFLEANNKYIVGNLIKSIVVASANDACVAMAEKCAGSEELFVNLMNERAKELGMNNTRFANCTGLPKPNQYSSAKDVSIMFCELLKHQEYFRYSRIWTDSIYHSNERKTDISNTNKLVRFYDGCDSGKTGYTHEAGHCLVASATRNGMRLVSVVISAHDSKTRFKEVSSMFNYGFANYTNKLVIDSDKPLDIRVDVEGGKQDNISVLASKSFYIFSRKDQKRSVEITFSPNERIKAPIYKGDKVGQLSIYENGIEIGKIDVLSNEDILARTYFDEIINIAKNWALI